MDELIFDQYISNLIEKKQWKLSSIIYSSHQNLIYIQTTKKPWLKQSEKQYYKLITNQWRIERTVDASRLN